MFDGFIENGLENMFGYQDPSDAASGYLNKLPGMYNSIFNPYMQAGQNALAGMSQYENRGNAAGNALMGQYNQMTNDPGGLINKMGSSFHQSPGYAFQTSQALGAANRAAAAGGMAGSPAEQQNIAGVTNQLANQDYYNYLNHAQNVYGMGIQGMQHTEGLGANLGEDIYNQGANAAGNLAQGLGSAYMSQASNAYSGAINNNQRIGAMIGPMFSGPHGQSGIGGSSGMGGNGGYGGMQYEGQGMMPTPFSGGYGSGMSGNGMSEISQMLPYLSML